ncbi:HAD-IA family hydrolase [Phaeovulum sp.]|uniref:HAD-IA family hydrolase n=1 Tax=Phaeovulum sp. TaxID=2934796 RepID=UPI0039E4567C
MTLKLVVFDIDGTLSDSQAMIFGAMSAAFGAAGLPAPDLAQVLRIVGLSLPQAVARLAPTLAPDVAASVVDNYKNSYSSKRAVAPAPLYPGALECVQRLSARDDLLLGIATGKSRRGLDALLRHHGLGQYFVTRQVADDHPSKPNPAMLFAAMKETGVGASDAVMIGDTTFDVEMGAAAGLATVGVSWGYHPVAELLGAGVDRMADSFDAVEAAVNELLGGA